MSGRAEVTVGENGGRVGPRADDEAAARKDPGGAGAEDVRAKDGEDAGRGGAARRRLKRVVPVVLAALAGGLLIWSLFLRRPDAPENVVPVSGRVEGNDAAVAAKTSGRIREITVREGDEVRAREEQAE